MAEEADELSVLILDQRLTENQQTTAANQHAVNEAIKDSQANRELMREALQAVMEGAHRNQERSMEEILKHTQKPKRNL